MPIGGRSPADGVCNLRGALLAVVHHHVFHPLTWTRAGLWLIGFGAFVTTVAAIAGSPRAVSGGIRFTGPLTERRERVAFGVDAAGLLVIAIGSIIIAATELPQRA